MPNLGTPDSLGFCEDYEPLPASRPTHAPPGSDAKIAVLTMRAKRGEELFHPRDKTIDWNRAKSGLVERLSLRQFLTKPKKAV
jgi:hypothetical protein